VGLVRLAILVALAGLLVSGCGPEGRGDAPAPPAAAACAEDRTLACAYFDGSASAWSSTPPSRVSLAAACAPSGLHGEIDAFVDSPGQYWLDHLGFEATGSAVRTASLSASDDAGGVTYGCGQGGAKVLTQLLCGHGVGTGTLALRFSFAGHWSDGASWTKECGAVVEVVP
jgi:hypothetical protein